VGPDVTRFVMLTRKNDAPLDFDFDKVTEQSKDNPVFYVQYAHARIRSVMRKVGRRAGSDADVSIGPLPTDEAELEVIQQAGRMAASGGNRGAGP
jgi:arginyl-tRNA synthetase